MRSEELKKKYQFYKKENMKIELLIKFVGNYKFSIFGPAMVNFDRNLLPKNK